MREGRAYLKPEEVGLAEVEACEQGRLDKAQSKTKPETSSEVLIIDFLVPFQDGTVLFPRNTTDSSKEASSGLEAGEPSGCAGCFHKHPMC